MSQQEDYNAENVGWSADICRICGRSASALYTEATDEPIICNRCIVDMRKDMTTELEVRRQLGNLEARVEGLNTRQWILSFVFPITLGLLMFLLGLWLGG
jgi:hypothetical protein